MNGDLDSIGLVNVHRPNEYSQDEWLIGTTKCAQASPVGPQRLPSILTQNDGWPLAAFQ